MIRTFVTHPRTLPAARATRMGVWALFVLEAVTYRPGSSPSITVSPASLLDELRFGVALTLLLATAFSLWAALMTTATGTPSMARCRRTFGRVFTLALAAPVFLVVLGLAVSAAGVAVCLVQLSVVMASYLLAVAASELGPPPLLEDAAA